MGSTFHVAGAASFAGTIGSTGTATFQTLIVPGQTALASATVNSTLTVLGATSMSTLTAAQLVVSGTASIADTSLLTGAWTSYTPSVSWSVGTGSATALGRYQLIGKSCHVAIQVTINSSGSSDVAMLATLPFSSAGSVSRAMIGRNLSGGAMRVASITAGASQVTIANFDNSYSGGAGSVIVVSGTYEIA